MHFHARAHVQTHKHRGQGYKRNNPPWNFHVSEQAESLVKEKDEKMCEQLALVSKECDTLEKSLSVEREQSKKLLEQISQIEAELKTATEEKLRLIEREKAELEKSESAAIDNLTSDIGRLEAENKRLQNSVREAEEQLEAEKTTNKNTENELQKTQVK